MNTIKCQILLKAVELGSITRAAEDMGYTQSAVSRSIADLEREWDVTLLTRNKDGVVLTDDCAAVERLGFPVCLTQGSEENIKITTPSDLVLGELILAHRRGF